MVSGESVSGDKPERRRRSIRFKNGFNPMLSEKRSIYSSKKTMRCACALLRRTASPGSTSLTIRNTSWNCLISAIKKASTICLHGIRNRQGSLLTLLKTICFYFALFKVSDSEGGGYVRMHHLISDAWSMGLLTKQLVAYYTAFKNGLPADDSPNPPLWSTLKAMRRMKGRPGLTATGAIGTPSSRRCRK